MFALLVGTGMRIGEAAGLHVDDLDLDNGVIYVRRAVWNGREQSPKTKKGIRLIDIDCGLVDLLKQHLVIEEVGVFFRRVTVLRSQVRISSNVSCIRF